MNKGFFVLVAGIAISGPQDANANDCPSDLWIQATITRESSGDDKAIGDKFRKGKLRPESKWAYGPLQIRQPACDDVNKRFGTNYRSCEMFGDRALSIRVCRLYLSIYATEARLGRKVTDEDCSRIWNGGPDAWMEEKKWITDKYWAKISQTLADLRKVGDKGAEKKSKG